MPPMSAPVQRRHRSALAAVGARRRPGGGGAAVRGPGRGVAPGPPRRRGGPGALQGEFDLAVERHDEARTQLAALQVEVNDTQATVETLIARSAGNHEQAETIVRALYRGAGQHAVTAVLPADGIGDAGRRLGYLGAGQPAQDAVLERLVSDRVAMEADLARLGEARSAATATEAELDRIRFDVESMLADQEREVSELEAAIARAVAEHAAREQASAPGTRVPGAAASRAAGVAGPAEEPTLADVSAPDEPSGGDGGAGSGTNTPPEQPASPDVPDRPSATTVPGPDREPPPVSAPAPNSGGETAVEAALSQVGKPYLWGADGPDAYDCSGLMLWAWAMPASLCRTARGRSPRRPRRPSRGGSGGQGQERARVVRRGREESREPRTGTCAAATASRRPER